MGVDGTPGSSCALQLDPFALPVRFAARDSGADGKIRQIELDRERVTLRREVRGMRMKVGVPISAFRGVSMRVLPPQDEAAAAVIVTLEHRDINLSVPLLIACEGGNAVASWKAWGRVLGLPLLVADSDGSLREPNPRIGRVALGRPGSRRRRRAAIRWRRPSILMRRKPGRVAAQVRIYRDEHEIIARN